MTIKIINTEASNNGGDGLHLGPNAKVDVSGFRAHGNAGRGVYIDGSADATLAGVVATKNSGGGIVVGQAEQNPVSGRRRRVLLGTTALVLGLVADVKTLWPF